MPKVLRQAKVDAGAKVSLSAAALAFVLATAYRDVRGVYAAPAAIETAAAHVRLEGLDEVRGCGKRGYNFGGLTSKSGCRRGANPARVTIFPSRRAAAVAYWKVILRCDGALAAFATKDARQAAYRLKACHYMGEDASVYGQTWARILEEKRRKKR